MIRCRGNGFNVLHDDLAALLSLVLRRTGSSPTSSPILQENGWCRVNHFDVEKLLKIVAERDPSFDPSEPARAPSM